MNTEKEYELVDNLTLSRTLLNNVLLKNPLENDTRPLSVSISNFVNLFTFDKYYKGKYTVFEKSYNLQHCFEALQTYIGYSLQKYINKKRSFFYKKFEKEYLISTIESEYDKLKGSLVNYFTEKPLEDIFEIAFSRYLSDNIGLVSKHIMNLVLEIKSICINSNVRFVNFVESDDPSYEEVYVLNMFEIIRIVWNTITSKRYPEVCKILLGYNPSESRSECLKFNIDRLNLNSDDIVDFVSNIILKVLRNSFMLEYERCIYKETNKTLTNICVDIKAFYVRNAITYKGWLDEILQDLVYLNFDERPMSQYVTRMFLDILYGQCNAGFKNGEVYKEPCSFNDFASKMFADWYSLLSKIGGKSRTSALKYANTYIDVGDLNNELQLMINKLNSLYGTFSEFYTNYCKYGKNDYDMLRQFLAVVGQFFEFECFDDICIDEANLFIEMSNKQIRDINKNCYKDIKQFANDFNIINFQYKQSIEDGGYGDNLDTLIKDLDELFTQFKQFITEFYIGCNNLTRKILEWLKNDINAVIKYNLEYEPLREFMDYIRSRASVSYYQFFILNNQILQDIGVLNTFRSYVERKMLK